MWLPGWILRLCRRSGLQSVLIVSEAPFLNASEYHHSFKVYIAHFKTVSNLMPMRVHTALPLRQSEKYSTSFGTATPEYCGQSSKRPTLFSKCTVALKLWGVLLSLGLTQLVKSPFQNLWSTLYVLSGHLCSWSIRTVFLYIARIIQLSCFAKW